MSTRILLILAFAAPLTGPALAGEYCHHCGCCQDVVAVCRPSCDKKEVTETVYEVVCEDFCVPGCSHARKCETPCGECQTVWEPSCGRVRTRQKLVKKEVTHVVPVTKCTVVYLCPRCCQACGCTPCQPMAAQGTGETPVALGVTTPPALAGYQPTPPLAAPPVKPRSAIWSAMIKKPKLVR